MATDATTAADTAESTECAHTDTTHTPGWPTGTVGGRFLFPPVTRCNGCGVEVTPDA